MTTTTIMPGAKGADYVYLTPAIKEWLLANDCTFVARYFVSPSSTRINKDFKREELEWLTEHRIAIVPNFEHEHDVSDDDRPGGLKDGAEIKGICEDFGVPHAVPVCVSVDMPSLNHLDSIERYVRAFAEAIQPYSLGLYGDDNIAYRVRDLNPLYWRVNAMSWHNGPNNGRSLAHFQQHLPKYPPGVDPNTAVQPFTAWAPWLPITTPEEPDMNYRLMYFASKTGPHFVTCPGGWRYAVSGDRAWVQSNGGEIFETPDPVQYENVRKSVFPETQVDVTVPPAPPIVWPNAQLVWDTP